MAHGPQGDANAIVRYDQVGILGFKIFIYFLLLVSRVGFAFVVRTVLSGGEVKGEREESLQLLGSAGEAHTYQRESEVCLFICFHFRGWQTVQVVRGGRLRGVAMRIRCKLSYYDV